MSKIIIKESELVKLIEIAMDLDRYVQQSNYDTNNGNESLEESIESIIDRLKELLGMFKYGKKIPTTTSSELYGVIDKINNIYNEIKFED